MRIATAAMAIFLMTAGAMAQEEEAGPCDRPTDKKVLKALADAQGTRNPTERHQKLKALMENGRSAPNASSAPGKAPTSAPRQAPEASPPASNTWSS